MNKNICFLLLCIFLQHGLSAQDKPNVRFGNIKTGDFDLSKYKIDSSAAAVVIADIGEAHYEKFGNGLRMVFTRTRRAKIINKNGYNIAAVSIPFSLRGNVGDKILGLKASTYNLENGKVSEQTLDDKSVFVEDLNTYTKLKKFTFPGLKEGCIIEYTYSLYTDIELTLRSWEFQGKYPCLWSEYTVSIPDMLTYVNLEQGENLYFINTTDYDTEYGLKSVNHHWVMKNVPALQEEKYTTTIDNYISKIEFELQSVTTNGISRDVLPGWPKIAGTIMEMDNFGSNLNNNNHWLDADLAAITRNTPDKLEKAIKIYTYVRDNFKCTQQNKALGNTQPELVFKNKAGSDAEINLLLCTMLNHVGIHSDPVILSTRSHGFVNDVYPMLPRYNKTVCDIEIDSRYYFLDASEKYLGFNHLGEECYNGQAMVITRENGLPVYFVADSLNEVKQTTVFIVNDEKAPQDLTGSFQSTHGYYESIRLRENIAKTTESGYFRELKTLNSNGRIEMENFGLDSLTRPGYPLTEHYDFSFKNIGGGDIIYFSPIFAVGIRENPFKSAERKYPVEMPYKIDEIYSLDMEIPKGFRIDEMPKSSRVLLNDTDGFFEYMIDQSETSIHLQTRLKLNRANYLPADYNALREFYALVVKKQAEQIVFKKIK